MSRPSSKDYRKKYIYETFLHASNRETLLHDEKGLNILIDFLAQKFTKAYLLAKTDDELNRLRDLWQSITGAEES
jgi:hypothetical protein